MHLCRSLFSLLLLCLADSIAGQDLRDSIMLGTDTLEATVSAPFGLDRRQAGSVVLTSQPWYSSLRSNKTSLVHDLNVLPGVRMEERSPGSYRLNIRGSSLRAPFGVRNVKVYYNDLPLTDPGGNTYLNQLTANNYAAMDLVKGPAGSLYGAGTGGLLMVHALSPEARPGFDAEVMAGSFGLFNVLAGARFGPGPQLHQVTYAHNESQGYRDHSYLRRDNASWTSRLRYGAKSQLTASVLFSDMYYQTPGGLTQQEFDQNPRAARPAAGIFPSAEEAKAAIFQQNMLAGLSHTLRINDHWQHSLSVYSAFARVKNSAIRNYEQRSEPHAGARTEFTYVHKKADGTSWQWTTGGEYQAGWFNTQIYTNQQGNPGSLLSNDDLSFRSWFAYTQLHWHMGQGWQATAGTSVNQNNVKITRLGPVAASPKERTYQSEWTPRLQVQKQWKDYGQTSFIISKGYSPPTVSELLPSTGVISTSLEAEHGINYELIHRMPLCNRQLRLTLHAYYFQLEDALVQQRDASGGDYFENAGSTRQAGLEIQADWLKRWENHRLWSSLRLQASWSYQPYVYLEYQKSGTDYSGLSLPGVPRHLPGATADLQTRPGWYARVSWYYNSQVYLNDANTATAGAFHLVNAQVGLRKALEGKTQFGIYIGADNLANAIYTQGPDINAAGGRYFNAAPGRNAYGGISLGF